MGLIWILFLICVIKADSGYYYETDTRIVIVSSEIPEDGHLRLFRSANSRNLYPVMLNIKNQTSEVEEVSKYLNSIAFPDNEIALITPSVNYIATNDASNFGMNVAKVALTKDGSVVMAYPMNHNLSLFSTPVDPVIEKIKESLDYLRSENSDSYHPSPEDLEEWKLGTVLYSKYRRLLVKQKKYQYKYASVYKKKYCAFAGLTNALKKIFEQLTSKGMKNSSLTEICNTFSKNQSLAIELRVVMDFEGHVFKQLSSPNEDVILIKDPKSKNEATHLQSNTYTYSPFTFAESGKLPYVVANFATGDIIAPVMSQLEYLDNKIENFYEYFHGIKNIPTVQIIAIITKLEKDFENFLKNLAGLSYSKYKTKIDIIFQHTHSEEDMKNLQETINVIQSDNSTAFHSIRAVVIDNSDVNSVYEKAWSFAAEAEANYSFLVDSSVQFTDREVIEKLIQINRKVVSPILKSKNADFNFKAESEDNDVKDNILSVPFSSQYEDMIKENISTIGVLQVPYVFGALLLRKDVIQRLDLFFDLCPLNCGKSDELCQQKKASQQCEDNYYYNLKGSNQKVWGMMCKNIVENGFIIYLSNENIYGDFNLVEEENLENEEEVSDGNKDEVGYQLSTSAIEKTPTPYEAVIKNQNVI